MTQYQTSQISMTTANTNRFTTLQSDGQNQNVKIVATADVRTKQVGGKLSFLLPGLTDTIHAEATLIRDDSSGFVWSGKITNKPGYVSFIKLNGLISGFIHVGTRFFELMPMGPNYQFLVERTPGTDKGCGSTGPTIYPTPSPSPGPDYCTSSGSAYNTCPALVYMLVVITPAAKTYIIDNYGSINDFVKEGQNLINLAFSNSDIPNKEVAIKWIEKDLTQANGSLSPTPYIESDRSKLPLFLEPERTNYRADVAFLITNQGYGNVGGAVYEYGPKKTTAYGLVEAAYFINYYSIAHELGHLFGCRHNRTVTAGNDDEVTCSHGYRWIENVGTVEPLQTYVADDSWGTLVSIAANTTLAYEQIDENNQLYFIQFTPAAATNRILHYSNPEISYSGYATGVAVGKTADNARLIRNNACEVSDFFESQDLSLFIKTSSCAFVPFTFTADIIAPKLGFPGQGPYTVTWFWNSNGNFNTASWNGGNETYLGSGQILTINSHPICPGFYWVKCKVVAADGTTIVRFKKIDQRRSYCSCNSTMPSDGDDRSLTIPAIKGIHSLSVYPNPTTDGALTIENLKLLNSPVYITVSDLSGRLMLLSQLNFDDHGKAFLNFAAFSDGLYLLQIVGCDGTRYNATFIIANH